MLLPDTQLLESLTDAFKAIPYASDDTFIKAKEIRSTLLANDHVSATVQLVSKVLEEQGFVQIRGFLATEAERILTGWACLLGNPHIDMDLGGGTMPAHVRPGHVRPGQHLMGNQLRHLPLHTDYSMLESPPWLTVSFCRHPDPIKGLGNLAVVDAEAAWFGLESSQEFSRLTSVLFPFAGMSCDKTTEVIYRPIIRASEDDKPFLVRYHRSRIVQGFRCTNTTATDEQAGLMMYFEDRMNLLSHSLTIQSGDLTIIDNHRMLHGRGRCSVEISNDMTVSGRKMLFAFAHSIEPYDPRRQ